MLSGNSDIDFLTLIKVDELSPSMRGKYGI